MLVHVHLRVLPVWPRAVAQVRDLATVKRRPFVPQLHGGIYVLVTSKWDGMALVPFILALVDRGARVRIRAYDLLNLCKFFQSQCQWQWRARLIPTTTITPQR